MEQFSKMIKCKCKNCYYNKKEQGACFSPKIYVEGLYSKSRLGTFCSSFKTPKESEMSCCNLNIREETKTTVNCSANYCKWYKQTKCTKDALEISDETARYRSETQCESFELK